MIFDWLVLWWCVGFQWCCEQIVYEWNCVWLWCVWECFEVEDGLYGFEVRCGVVGGLRDVFSFCVG